MPILHLQMHPGRTDDQKRAFAREATKAAVERWHARQRHQKIVSKAGLRKR